MMKRNYKILLLSIVLAFASCSFTTKKFDNSDKDKLLIQIIKFVLERGHFDPIALDDTFSAKLFKDYIETLDPAKRYFYSFDIEAFEEFELLLDDDIKSSNITFFDVTHELILRRIEEAKEIYKEILDKPFNYNLDETFQTDYDKKEFVDNKKQMVDRWRKQLKYATISNYNDIYAQEEQEKKNDDSYVMKSVEQMEKEARVATLKSIDIYFNDSIDDLQREDWFSIYVNTIVEEFDPHTYYLAPKSKEVFDMDMSGKLEGIGARLQKRMDYIKIVELISGGPAWRSNELEVEDIILKVKQENEKLPVDIVGMRINDAIKHIKGPKGTKVTLTVKKVDGSIKDVVITRDVIQLEETYAKSAVIEKEGEKFGIINLPKFYVDFENYKQINAAQDVKKEIEHLKMEGIGGLVLDLRNNGGGSLPTVVDMAGLFIEEGPVVQVRSTGKNKEVLRDRDSSITWDGPLVLLVNELSASASEIMAAAMQDYKRAIIIGGKQTYGKGTVQNVYNLNELVKVNTNGDLGALAFTTQKYYRINGGSVQLEGVRSDVEVPGRYSFVDIGEKEKDNPLPWDEISAADYTLWKYSFDYDTTVKRSKQRMANNNQFKLIEKRAKWVKGKSDENIVSLNYEAYSNDLKLKEKEFERFDSISKYKTNLTFKSHAFERSMFKKDTTDLKEKRDRWHKKLNQDVYVEEALNVLKDLKTFSTEKLVSNRGN